MTAIASKPQTLNRIQQRHADNVVGKSSKTQPSVLASISTRSIDERLDRANPPGLPGISSKGGALMEAKLTSRSVAHGFGSGLSRGLVPPGQGANQESTDRGGLTLSGNAGVEYGPMGDNVLGRFYGDMRLDLENEVGRISAEVGSERFISPYAKIPGSPVNLESTASAASHFSVEAALNITNRLSVGCQMGVTRSDQYSRCFGDPENPDSPAPGDTQYHTSLRSTLSYTGDNYRVAASLPNMSPLTSQAENALNLEGEVDVGPGVALTGQLGIGGGATSWQFGTRFRVDNNMEITTSWGKRTNMGQSGTASPQFTVGANLAFGGQGQQGLQPGSGLFQYSARLGAMTRANFDGTTVGEHSGGAAVELNAGPLTVGGHISEQYSYQGNQAMQGRYQGFSASLRAPFLPGMAVHASFDREGRHRPGTTENWGTALGHGENYKDPDSITLGYADMLRVGASFRAGDSRGGDSRGGNFGIGAMVTVWGDPPTGPDDTSYAWYSRNSRTLPSHDVVVEGYYQTGRLRLDGTARWGGSRDLSITVGGSFDLGGGLSARGEVGSQFYDWRREGDLSVGMGVEYELGGLLNWIPGSK